MLSCKWPKRQFERVVHTANNANAFHMAERRCLAVSWLLHLMINALLVIIGAPAFSATATQ